MIFLSDACSGIDTANVNSPANIPRTNSSNPGVTARDDVEELGKIVKLPILPEEASFTENALNANEPDKKRLVAVLEFAAADANQIAANAEKYAAPVPFDVDAEDWFPPELIAKSRETGDVYLKGVSFSAQDFFQPPYSSGRLTRVKDTNYFVLELSTY